MLDCVKTLNDPETPASRQELDELLTLLLVGREIIQRTESLFFK